MLKRGMVVISLNGREAGRCMAVLSEEGSRVLLADGKRRKLETPKRKNPRHLRITGQEISEASMATDRELRRTLHKVSVHITEGG